jgi:DNA polymerase-1
MLKLDTLCLIYFGLNLKEQSDIDVTNLDNLPLPVVLKYNSLDAKYTVMLSDVQKPILRSRGLGNIYYEQVRRIASVVLTQLRGLHVDQAFVKKTQTILVNKLEEIDTFVSSAPETKKFRDVFKQDFNIDSPHDVNKLVTKILKSPNVKFTAKGNPSVDDEVLKKVDHPVTTKILEHRETNKLKSTYIDNLCADSLDGDIFPDLLSHPNINLTFTTTSRSSYRNPNWQNFPKKKNKNLTRPALIAPPGHSFVAIDYGQIQARIIAMYSRDPTFVKSLWERLDVHQDWAEKIVRRYPMAVNNDFSKDAMSKFRDKVKNKWVFPSFFGAGKKSVAGYMNIPINVAEDVFDEFWREFSGVKKWQKNLQKTYKKNGYVEMLTGRRRHGPLAWQDMINHPVQGLEAEIVFDAYNRLSEKSQAEDKPWMSPVLLVHDDLSFYIPDDIIEDALEEIITEMLTFKFPWINVPVSLEVSVGKNWYETKEVGKFFSDKWNA